MAILPVFDRIETKEIIKMLMHNPQTAADLNKTLVIERSICSTSTLYRRLNELQIAGIIEKDGKLFRLTKYGEKLFSEYTRQPTRLTAKELRILKKLRRPVSFVELYKELNISPNKLQEILQELEEENLIKRNKETESSGAGRPKILYSSTKEGERVRKKGKDLERKAKHKR